MQAEVFIKQTEAMQKMTSEILENLAFTVPYVDRSQSGMAWLRGDVVRFSEGADHRRRRLLTEQILAGLVVDPVDGGDPAAALLEAMGLPTGLAADVALAAAGYQPHFPQSAAADEAVEQLVASLGARDKTTAAFAFWCRRMPGSKPWSGLCVSRTVGRQCPAPGTSTLQATKLRWTSQTPTFRRAPDRQGVLKRDHPGLGKKAGRGCRGILLPEGQGAWSNVASGRSLGHRRSVSHALTVVRRYPTPETTTPWPPGQA